MSFLLSPKYQFSTPIPLLRISCGLFGISEDFSEGYQSLDERFVKNRSSTFFFEATGSSMEPTIFAGEVLLVDRSISSYHNRVCVVAYEGDLLCKRVVNRGGSILLRSDNQDFEDIKVGLPEESIVWGVVVAKFGDVL